jgi:hypothetical protein
MVTAAPLTPDELHAITAASAGLRGLFVHLPATGNVVFSPRDTDELHTISEDLEPHVAEPLVVMLDGVPRLLAEVERLTQERDAAKLEADASSVSIWRLDLEGKRSGEGIAELRAALVRDRDAVGQSIDAHLPPLTVAGTLLDRIAAAGRVIATQVAELESLAPHTRDTETEPDAEVLAAPARCDCCSVVIPAGDSAVMFEDETGRACWAHYGRCPEPEMWCVEWENKERNRWTAENGWLRWIRARLIGGQGIEQPYEDAFVMALGLSTRTSIERVRLVRVRKEVARG